MPERVKPRSLIDRLGFQHEVTIGAAAGTEHREIINHVDTENRGRTRLARPIDHIDAIALGRVNDLGDHMIVCDN